MRTETADALLAALAKLYDGDQKALLGDILDSLSGITPSAMPKAPRGTVRSSPAPRLTQKDLILQVLGHKELSTAQIKAGAWNLDPDFPAGSISAKLKVLCDQGTLSSRKNPGGKGKLYKKKG
jgi:hypothetical protein